MGANKNYQNRYFSILGDSISTFEGITEPKTAVYYDTNRKLSSGVVTLADTWWWKVIERLGGRLLVNNSWSGSTVCFSPLFQVPSYGCSDERTSSLDRDGITPDVIIVFLGVNDWGKGLRVVDKTSAKATEENCSLFSTAYKTMLRKLKKNYPSAEIWCFTLPITTCSRKEKFEFPYYFGGRHIAEYCEAIQESAAQYDCRVVDIYHSGEAYDTWDSFHPNASGMTALADSVIRLLKA